MQRPVALAGLALIVATSSTRAETLADAIALAYQSNPVLQAQRANLRATDETYVQAQAGYRPTITAQGLITTNENTETFTQPVPGNSQTTSAVITLTQPIYTGGRVASQLSAAQATVMAGRETLRSTEQQVLQQVIQAYIDTRRDQQAVAINKANVQLLERQLVESKARFAVGDITRTDVAETETRVLAARSQLAAAESQLATSRAEYSEIVGQNPGQLAPEPSLAALLPPTLELAFAVAEHDNPQIGQQDYTEQASAAKIAAAKSQTRPTASLQATYGYSAGAFGIDNPFQNQGHAFTATAVVTVPLFTGGTTTSQIRQATEANNVDRIGIEQVRRQTLFAVSQAWNQLVGSRSQLKTDEEQVGAANIAFEGTRREAQVGQRTTLDVLITEQDFSSAELALVAARHDEYQAGASLLVAMGKMRAESFSPSLPVYDPVTNFDRVRHSPGWTPLEPAISALDHLGAPKIVERPDPVEPPAPAPVSSGATP
ncbi:MAG TPA: TolC family outer membrane protein [Caulobacteraceae bacterium]|nr:TolC family outer membrane protein [Caulobacteraceae bacterium]